MAGCCHFSCWTATAATSQSGTCHSSWAAQHTLMPRTTDLTSRRTPVLACAVQETSIAASCSQLPAAPPIRPGQPADLHAAQTHTHHTGVSMVGWSMQHRPCWGQPNCCLLMRVTLASVPPTHLLISSRPLQPTGVLGLSTTTGCCLLFASAALPRLLLLLSLQLLLLLEDD